MTELIIKYSGILIKPIGKPPIRYAFDFSPEKPREPKVDERPYEAPFQSPTKRSLKDMVLRKEVAGRVREWGQYGITARFFYDGRDVTEEALAEIQALSDEEVNTLPSFAEEMNAEIERRKARADEKRRRYAERHRTTGSSSDVPRNFITSAADLRRIAREERDEWDIW